MSSFTKNRDRPQNRQVCLTTPGIELEYDIVSVQQYALAQKSLPIHKHCVLKHKE